MADSLSRIPDHPVLPLIVERWSPRSFTGEPIPDAVLFSLFEAARWAPSAYNSQPWRFVYGTAGTPGWQKIFNLLVPFNQGWGAQASALVLVLSKSTFSPAPGKEQQSGTHAFDTGAAWANLALQAQSLGWFAHAASGFDHDKARADFALPADVHPLAVLLIGRQGDPATLPEALRARETPSPRKPVAEFVFEGSYPG